MNFYESFLSLCDRRDVTPSRALLDAGLSKSLASKWKAQPTTVPNGETLQKLALYFCVSIDYFTNPSKKKGNKPSADGMPEMEQLLEAAHYMTPAVRQQILQYAKFVAPDAFENVYGD